MKNHRPKISVIVPVYNVEKYLRRCLDSIISQSFTDFELLLIDDGSSDKSGVICDEYAKKDTRVKVFHASNGGVSSARNIGLDNATGEWIAFCDSDDYVFNGWLDGFIQCIDANTEFVICSFTARVASRDIDYIVDDNLSLLEAVDSLENRRIFGFLWCKLFSNSIISDNHIRFNPNYSIWEDSVFLYNYIIYVNSIKTSSYVGYYYYWPDFKNKYGFKDKFYCCIDIIKYANEKFKRRDICTFKKYQSIAFSYIKYACLNEDSATSLFKLKVYIDELKFVDRSFWNHSYLNNILFMMPPAFGNLMLRLGLRIKEYYLKVKSTMRYKS